MPEAGRQRSGDRPKRAGQAFWALVVSAAGLTALLPLQSRAADEPVAERPIFHDGDVFEYLDRFESLDCKRWQITGHDADGSLVSTCGDNVAYFSAQTGALLRIVGKGGKALVKFDPTSPALPFPLHVGSTWHGKFRVSTRDQIISPGLNESCEVTSFETVAIAAGSMSAFRYECVTEWSVWPLHGTITETGWYAPAAKVVVKVINSSAPKWNLELTHFTLK